jgi:hypothetical protein
MFPTTKPEDIPLRPYRGDVRLVSDGRPQATRVDVYDGSEWLTLPGVVRANWTVSTDVRLSTLELVLDPLVVMAAVRTPRQRVAVSMAVGPEGLAMLKEEADNRSAA